MASDPVIPAATIQQLVLKLREAEARVEQQRTALQRILDAEPKNDRFAEEYANAYLEAAGIAAAALADPPPGGTEK